MQIDLEHKLYCPFAFLPLCNKQEGTTRTSSASVCPRGGASPGALLSSSRAPRRGPIAPPPPPGSRSSLPFTPAPAPTSHAISGQRQRHGLQPLHARAVRVEPRVLVLLSLLCLLRLLTLLRLSHGDGYASHAPRSLTAERHVHHRQLQGARQPHHVPVQPRAAHHHVAHQLQLRRAVHHPEVLRLTRPARAHRRLARARPPLVLRAVHELRVSRHGRHGHCLHRRLERHARHQELRLTAHAHAHAVRQSLVRVLRLQRVQQGHQRR